MGVFVLIGVAILAGGGGGDFIGSVTFGVWGPHVAGFACGVAGAAWAGKAGKLSTGRDIGSGLMGLNSPMVLVVGLVFGAVGYLLNWLFGLVGAPWTDTVALSVVVSAIIARLVFGKTGVFGKAPAGQSRLARPKPGTEWLPWQCDPAQLVLIGLGAGLMSAFITKTIGADKGGNLVGFGLSAASLVFLQFGTEDSGHTPYHPVGSGRDGGERQFDLGRGVRYVGGVCRRIYFAHFLDLW